MSIKGAILFLFTFSSAVAVAQNSWLPAYGNSRTGITGMQFLKIAPDARSAGLAGNVLPVANDLSSVYWNAAGLTQLDTQKFHFQFGHTNYFAGLGLNYGAAAFKFKHQGALALSIINLSTGEIPVTTEFQPFGTGETYTVNSFSAGLTYAQKLTDQFAFGITGKYAREALAGVVTNNALFDLGLNYDIGKANTRFAVGISNFGFNVQPDGSLQRLTLNNKTQVSSFESVSVPAIFRLGFAWDAIKNAQHTLTGIAQLNHPTDNNESFGIGAEYAWKKTFFARTGYEFGQDESGLPAFGIGVRTQRNFGMLKFDYGFNNKDRLGSTHRFTLQISVF